MQDASLSNKDEFKDDIPQIEIYDKSRDEYIHALEMSVQLLQREVSNLRSQKSTHSKKETAAKKQKNRKEILYDFQSCKDEIEVINNLHEVINKNYSITESNIYYFASNKQIIKENITNTSSTLNKHVANLEEEGIIDWVIEQNKPMIIPNLSDTQEITPTFFILVPLFLQGKPFGIYIARTMKDKNSFSEDDLLVLLEISGYAAIALDNIRSSKEISEMNTKLELLNYQMLQSSKLASFGELSTSIINELNSPLIEIKGHLQFLETGVGDSKRRLQIIREKIQNIDTILGRFQNIISLPKNDNSLIKINVAALIDDVLLFSGSQLLRDGVKIEKIIESQQIYILGSKPQLEQLILNLLLKQRDEMADGGTVILGVFLQSENNVIINISGNGIGMSKKEIDNVFSDLNYKDNSFWGLNLSKSIIKQHNGSFSVYSEIGKGTTYKIVLPISKENNSIID